MKFSLSIEKRIFFGLILILGIAIANRMYMLHSLKEIALNNYWVADVHAKSMIQAEQLRYLAEVNISDTRGFLLSLDKERFLHSIYSARTDFASKMQEMEKQEFPDQQAMSPERMAILKKAKNAEASRNIFIDHAFGMLEKKLSRDDILKYLRKNAGPLRQELNDSLDELVQLESHHLDLAKIASDQTEKRIIRDMDLLFAISLLLLGMLVAFIISLVGQRKRLLDRTITSVEETKKAVHARDEVLSIVSHDLKNPLSAIDLNTQLLGPNSTVPKEVVAERIGRASSKMKELIQNLLDCAKIESGHLSLEIKEQGICEVLLDTQSIFEPIANKKSICMNVEMPTQDVQVHFDRARLFQILSNLVGNAIKFTDPGGTVKVSFRKDGNFVEVAVKDSGPGIPEADIPHLCDRFWQARETANHGTGLGLAITKGLIEAHRGKLFIESELGKGSVFRCRIPV